MNETDFRTTAPAISRFPRLSIPAPSEMITDSGTRMVVVDCGDQPVNKLTISYDGGIIDSDNPAATILMTQMLREGAAGMSGADISERLDYNGAWLKAEPTSHHIAMSLYSMNSSATDLYRLLRDILTKPTFPADEFEAIKEKMATAAAVSLKRVSVLSAMTDKELTFGSGHPMTRNTPSPDDYRNLTRDDVTAAWRRSIAGCRPTVYLAGLTGSLHDEAARLFGDLGDRVGRIDIVDPRPSPERFRSIPVDDSLQSAVTMTIPTIGRDHPDYIDLRFAVMALGGYFGSRLMSTIREEKGYTYGISASLLGYLEGGFMTIATQTDPGYRDALVDDTLSEIERMRNEPMGSDELEKVRQYAMTSLAAILDSPFSIIEHYQNIDHNRISSGYFERQQTALARLTAERISQVMRRHLDPAAIKISVAGPDQNDI